MAANRKISELAQKPNCSQALDRVLEGGRRHAVRPVDPTTSPAITVATTPETFRWCSEMKKDR